MFYFTGLRLSTVLGVVKWTRYHIFIIYLLMAEATAKKRPEVGAIDISARPESLRELRQHGARSALGRTRGISPRTQLQLNFNSGVS